MRGLTRLLFMFGPMILREFQKYQRRKEREKYSKPQRPQYDPRNQRDQQYERGREIPRKKATPPPPPEPKISEEEKNFKMKEDEFMLDNETLKEYKESKNVMGDVVTDDVAIPKSEDTIKLDEAESKTTVAVNDTPSQEKDNDLDSDLDLKDIFFKDDEDDQDQRSDG